MKSVAVIGASLAGLSAARALRDQGFDGELTIVGGEARRPYDRPPLSKEFLAGIVGEDDLALESDDEDLHANWLLGVHASETRCGRRRGGTRRRDDDPCRRRRRGHRRSGAGVAGRGRPCRGARAAHPRRRPGPARRAAAGRAAGGDRRRVHRRRSRLDRKEIGPGRDGRRGRADTAGRPARRATRCRSGPAARRARHPVAVRGGRCRALRAAIGSPAWCWPTGVGCPPTSSSSVSARCPTSSGCATARSNWPAACVCDEGGATSIPNVVAVGDCSAWREACIGRPHRVEHWTGALERPAIAVATLLAGGRYQGTPARPPYFWSDQYGSRIQFAGIAGPHDEITFEVGSADDASFLAVYRRGGSTRRGARRRPAATVHPLAPSTRLRPGGILTRNTVRPTSLHAEESPL